MQLSYYDLTVAPFSKMLTNCRAALAKAETFAKARDMNETDLLNLRLAPDMFPLARQIQIAIDGARGCVLRLEGREPPQPEAFDYAVFNRGDDSVFHPDAQSFAELISRLDTVCRMLSRIRPNAMKPPQTIVLQMYGRTRIFAVQNFLVGYVLPNFYFHLSIAYAILRHAGVPLGKQDFEGEPVYTSGIAANS